MAIHVRLDIPNYQTDNKSVIIRIIRVIRVPILPNFTWVAEYCSAHIYIKCSGILSDCKTEIEQDGWEDSE